MRSIVLAFLLLGFLLVGVLDSAAELALALQHWRTRSPFDRRACPPELTDSARSSFAS